MTTATAKRITLATVKSFINKNRSKLQISVQSDFDSMSDCVTESDDQGFSPIREAERFSEHNLGISGAWFVLSSRDYLGAFEDETMVGYRVSNCCGAFVLAVSK